MNDLDFFDHLGLEVDLLFGSYPCVDMHDPCALLLDSVPHGSQAVVNFKILVRMLEISCFGD